MTPKNVTVVGQGYVGLPLAMRAVECGYRVVGFEIDEERVRRLRAGDSFVEDVDGSVLRRALDSGTYTASSDERAMQDFDVAVITVPTPLRDSLPDLSFIESAARMLTPHIRRGCTVILESTTYPGTTRELMVPILEQRSGLKAGVDFHVGYSPERIDPGNRTWTFRTTPKVVSGLTAACLGAVTSFYESLVDTVVPVSGCEEAELTKLLENTFRHVNVALVNELAIFAAELGIDVWEAIDAATTKPFGYMRFTPGPGVGGHCLPIDPSYLSWRVRQSLGKNFRFVELANDVNEHMPDYVVRRVTEGLNRARKAVNGSRILLIGLAYKRDTGDARESPSVAVAARLLGLGAEVQAVDPFVRSLPHALVGVDIVDLTKETIEAADAVIILTDHSAVDYDLVVAHARWIFDCRRRVKAGPNVESL